MNLKTTHWLKALIAAFVTGAASALLSALGISGAQMVGINIAQLNIKQLGVMTLFGGIIGAAAYLKQSPVPPDATTETVEESHISQNSLGITESGSSKTTTTTPVNPPTP